MCMLCCLRWLFLVLSLGFCLSLLTFHSPSLSLFLLFPSFPWYRCAKLISWSFGPFYPKICGSLMACATCLCLFSLWGIFYLLAGGCAFGELGMCLAASWWLWHSGDYSSSEYFLGSFVGAWSRSFVFGDCFVSNFIFLPFYNLCLLWPRYYGKVR